MEYEDLETVPAEAARMTIWAMDQNARMSGAAAQQVIEDQQRQIMALQDALAAEREENQRTRDRVMWLLFGDDRAP